VDAFIGNLGARRRTFFLMLPPNPLTECGDSVTVPGRPGSYRCRVRRRLLACRAPGRTTSSSGPATINRAISWCQAFKVAPSARNAEAACMNAEAASPEAFRFSCKSPIVL